MHSIKGNTLITLMVSFGTKWKETTDGWRQDHNGELHISSSADNTSVIKLGRMTWMGLMSHMGGIRGVYSVSVGNLKESTTWKT